MGPLGVSHELPAQHRGLGRNLAPLGLSGYTLLRSADSTCEAKQNVNDVFFGCMTCRVLVDAGYRWAWSMLEARGIVTRDNLIEAQRMLTAPGYWSPPDEPNSLWLVEGVLPRVQAFLQTHRSHTLRFGDFEELAGTADAAFLDWLDLSRDSAVGPRYFVEVLGLSRWIDVVEWVRTSKTLPWWWSESDLVDAARRRFEEAAAST